MQRDLQNLRKNYSKGSLIEDSIPENPYQLFEEWFNDAKSHMSIDEVNAMSLTTLGVDGYPKSRIVLLKEIEEGCFIFYSNYGSEKGRSMDLHHKVSINFFWPALERQIIIKGDVSKVSRQKSLSYFHRRPRGSQLGAWASNQSSIVKTRAELEKQLEDYKIKFENQEIPLPDNWGGYSISPISFEFWQGRPNRLHDRFLYMMEGKEWSSNRLAP
ncbi:pyridoxamine 5'-phosphate oxidase [Nonlabens ulvanivorans]|uniref:Pyridoxine/pyridoxamine 5'-phosphate oxidase n=1 Tax=Nonlabens ulvanivorans TaxID=906888 RepID=A0A084JW64_NONUL|nr:pyridoxamine 5'-phosphate oxidase [Nonlabens ulvanivorans]KEZ93198.1 pyridoxamine 5'-phosphate oxidase [Nonlabens ulvanivorans]PRX13680.1 pyridoxamine 5'-phosphate oxidase [Nonlabens ulvanivorans]